MDASVPASSDAALDLFLRLVDADDLLSHRRSLGPGGGGLFSPALTVWLSLSSHLYGSGSLECAWQRCGPREVAALSPRSARGERPLSPHPTGLAYARAALPQEVVDRAADALYERALAALGAQGRPVFLLDGSSLRLCASDPLREAFPPAENQHGPSHWPMARVVTALELRSGLALRPEWGPMFGEGAVGELELAHRLMDRLPDGALVVADRFFGVFQAAWKLAANFVLRLRDAQARALLAAGASLDDDVDAPAEWAAGATKDPFCPKGASLSGRLIVRRVRVPGRAEPVRLCLFTDDMVAPAEQIVGLYAMRWAAETDLRTLKRTVGLETTRSRSPRSLGKEVVLAFAAFNLVRALAGIAAYRAGVEPRRIGFTRAANAIRIYAGRGIRSHEDAEALLANVAARTLPERPGRKRPPRKVWPRSNPYEVWTHKT